MIEKPILIADLSCFGPNPVPLLVQLACRFESKVCLSNENKKINAKSMLGVMALQPSQGMTLNLVVEGPDEEAALAAVEDFLAGKKN